MKPFARGRSLLSFYFSAFKRKFFIAIQADAKYAAQKRDIEGEAAQNCSSTVTIDRILREKKKKREQTCLAASSQIIPEVKRANKALRFAHINVSKAV